MNDFFQPTCGRIVHFFPATKDSLEGVPVAEKYPAIVNNDDNYPDLHVMIPAFSGPIAFIRSVPHKSKFIAGQIGWWEWPEIKK